MNIKNFKKINDYLWEIPRSFRDDMRVPVRVYAASKMLEAVEKEAAEQVVNVATLPGIVSYSLAMPDIHTGYGFSIGGVAATGLPKGVISPGGVGYDINCGVRLMKSSIFFEDAKDRIEVLASQIQQDVPSGLGRGGRIKLDGQSMERVLREGARRVVKQGYGEKGDLEHCEEEGEMKRADPQAVSEQAKRRGRDQLGTLGSGNHFLEVQRVSEIYDEQVARILGLKKNLVCLMIHCGSRGLGHQVATDYIRLMIGAMRKYNIKLPDRELACAPFDSPEGQRYFGAMAASANFAWANRQIISHLIRGAWQRVLGEKAGKLELIYDVAHNIAKVEKYEVKGEKMNLLVHRKGATRAFGPGHPEIPDDYKKIGQPVLIPGSMGTSSYILVGTKKAEEETFGSTCHGAGRRMSRHAAIRAVRGEVLKKELESKGIVVKGGSWQGLAEEAPAAYKNVEEVVEVVDRAGISKKVAKLVPFAVIKG